MHAEFSATCTISSLATGPAEIGCATTTIVLRACLGCVRTSLTLKVIFLEIVDLPFMEVESAARIDHIGLMASQAIRQIPSV